MNREEIKKILPHREPMLLVDSVETDGLGQAVGEYVVPASAFFVEGHFPGNPVVPGVVLCEIMGQASCALFADRLAGKTPYFTGMNNVKFRQKVIPGDKLKITCRIVKEKPPFYFVSGQIEVNEKICATGEFSFAVS